MSRIEKNPLFANYYHINIEYIHLMLFNIHINKENIIDEIINNLICHLNNIIGEIRKTINNISLIDEYIFGLFSNIYIINDLFKYAAYKLDEIKSIETLNCRDDKYLLSLNKNEVFTKTYILDYIKRFLIKKLKFF